jgi:hypothetical protein
LTGRPVEVSKVKHMVGKRTDSDAVTMPEGTPTAALEENVEAIGTWERGSLLSRSSAEQVADWLPRKPQEKHGLAY